MRKLKWALAILVVMAVLLLVYRIRLKEAKNPPRA